ncbi:MAG: dimethyl sulfoxide reductase anchor subunit [Burkholderiaceae bacterium]|nr:dimethyl sulfoxide reductase anchor subunit [Burkholderiaceae bacterium]
MSFGPRPWQQTHWDWRAAGNFMCGGAGAGLIVFTVLARVGGQAEALLLLGGLALVALGLLCVWLEIGRPMRALHVFFNPRTSWMTREGFCAALLFPAGLAALLGVPGLAWVAAALALAFVYCQARILKAARGIPAWREPLIVPLVVATGLAEGGGLFLLSAPWHHAARPWLILLFAALVLARWFTWRVYRQRVGASAVARALAALDAAARPMRSFGTLGALVLAGVAITLAPGGAGPAASALVAAIAGVAAAATGSWVKYTLITRAAFNQGFALSKLPVRGARP